MLNDLFDMLQFTSHRLIDVGERYILPSESFSALLEFSNLLGLLVMSSWVKETRNRYLLIIISLFDFFQFFSLLASRNFDGDHPFSWIVSNFCLSRPIASIPC